MNYLGNEEADKMERALMTAFAGVIGLSIGLFILNKGKDDKNPPQNFDWKIESNQSATLVNFKMYFKID